MKRTNLMKPDVLISEVGPRDGLQSVQATMPTADKFRWIDALVAAGLREIEVASFVPAKHLPQMADAAAVVRHACTHPGVTVMALVPNLRGAEAALQAGVHKLTIPVSASAAHSLANVRRTREDMIDEVRAIVRLRDALAPGVRVEAGISTAFGCTLQGEVPEADVVWLATECIAAGADEFESLLLKIRWLAAQPWHQFLVGDRGRDIPVRTEFDETHQLADQRRASVQGLADNDLHAELHIDPAIAHLVGAQHKLRHIHHDHPIALHVRGPAQAFHA